MSTHLHPAFILHRRPYRETSFIVEFFTQEQGRLAAVVRGIRKKGSTTAPLLQAFRPLLISCVGKGELLTLSQVEANGPPLLLAGKNLRCGFYLNELLIRLLPKNDAHDQIFTIYQEALQDLAQPSAEVNEKGLRLFEKRLLQELGYGLPSKEEIRYREDYHYYFDLERGFQAYLPEVEKFRIADTQLFSGSILNALLAEHFEDKLLLQEFKRLMRLVYSALLGGRPLQSRRLFESMS